MAKIARDQIDKLHDYDILMTTRTLTLFGAIDEESAATTVKNLHLLAAASNEPITLLLNSEGGCWQSGMAIHNYIKSLPNHVTIKVMGSAQSMATVILQAADERLALPDTTIMVHHGTDGYEGHTLNYERWAEYSKAIRKRMCEIYAERSGKPVSYWQRKCTLDWWMFPPQAQTEGLLDSVVELS